MEDVHIRSLQAHEGLLYKNLRLRSLADAPDAYGSTLAEEQARPDDLWAARLAAAAVSDRDLPLVAERGGAAAGLLWAKFDAADPAAVNLFQMWVAPEHRGRGIAAALVRAAAAWAAASGATAVHLGVTCGDTPATRLYARLGFEPMGAPEPLREHSPLLSQAMRLALPAP